MRFTARPRLHWAAPLLAAVALSLLLGCEQRGDALKLINEARDSMARREPAAAIVLLKNALQQRPESVEARLLLAQALLDVGELPAAEGEARRLVDADLKNAPATLLLVEAMLGQNKNLEVVKEFAARLIEPAESQAQLRTFVALAQSARGDAADAQASVDEALKLVPTHRPARLLRARLLAARGDVAAAWQVAAELTAEAKPDPQAWLLEADLGRLTGAAPQAVEQAYLKALELRPTLMHAHVGLIASSVERDDLAGATQHWERLNKVLPTHPQTKVLQASLALLRGDARQVLEIAQPMLQRTPRSARLNLLVAEAELMLGNTERANTLLRRLANESDEPVARESLARLQVAAGQADEALATLRPDLQSERPKPATLTVAAQAQLLKGDLKAAEATFEQALKLYPQDREARTTRALWRLARGDENWALNELNAVARDDVRGIGADMALLSAHLRRGRNDAAQQAIDAIAAKQPQSPLADHLRGQLALLRKDSAAARQAFERALERDPGYLASVKSLAQLDIAAGNLAAARGRFEQLLQKQAANADAMLALAGIAAGREATHGQMEQWLQKAAAARPNDLPTQLAAIDLYLATGRAAKALSAAQALAATTQERPEVVDRVLQAQLAVGDRAAAMASAKKLLAADAKSAPAHLRLAEVHAAQRDWAQWGRSVRDALALAPDRLPTRQAAAELALRDSGPAHALTTIRALQKDFPTHAAGWLLEGDAQAAQKQWAAAAVAYRQAIGRAGAEQAPIRHYRALRMAGSAADADAFAERWQKEHPADLRFVQQRAEFALVRGELKSAEAQYRRLLQGEPDDPTALNNLAMLLVQQKNPEALALAERATKVAGERPDYVDTLALALANAGQLDRAIGLQTKAVQAQPGSGALRLTLARLYLQAGDKAKARTELKALAAMGSDFPAQSAVSQLLQQAGGS